MGVWSSDPLEDIRRIADLQESRGYQPDTVVVPMQVARELREDMQRRGIDNFQEYMVACFNEMSEEEKTRLLGELHK